MCFAFVYHINIDCLSNTLIATSCKVNEIGSPRRVETWLRYRNTGIKCLFQKINDTLPSLDIEPRVNDFANAKFRLYVLSCTSASWEVRVKYLS